jgi:hypothetical protein
VVQYRALADASGGGRGGATVDLSLFISKEAKNDSEIRLWLRFVINVVVIGFVNDLEI